MLYTVVCDILRLHTSLEQRTDLNSLHHVHVQSGFTLLQHMQHHWSGRWGSDMQVQTDFLYNSVCYTAACCPELTHEGGRVICRQRWHHAFQPRMKSDMSFSAESLTAK